VAVVSLALLLGLLAGPASADAYSPPPGGTLPSTQWIAFQFDSTSISNGDTVTLSVVGGSTGTTADLWGASGNWPGSWSTGGLNLSQVDASPCTVAAHPTQSCAFKVTSSPATYQNLLFGLNLTSNQVQTFQQTIEYKAPPTTTTTPPPAPDPTFNAPPPQLTSADHFTFTVQSPKSSAIYTWTLTRGGTTTPVDTQSGANLTSYTPPPGIFAVPGIYNLTLTAADPNTHASRTSPAASFLVPTPPQSPPPQSPPPQSPPPQVNQPVTPAPAAAPRSITQVSLTPRLTDFATPKPGAVEPVTVIWLWRPDWFQATANRPKTAGRPRSVARAAVSVGSNRGGPSATPWLAGLATFGIFGAAWLAVRRRRVRTSILD